MASGIMHQNIAEFLNTHYFHFKDRDRIMFLIGATMVDTPNFTGKPIEQRNISHFARQEETTLLKEHLANITPDIDKFIAEYKSRLNDPFFLGYLSHLWGDKKYAEFLEKLSEKYMSEIDSEVISVADIKTENFNKWYKDNIYPEFDSLDITLSVLELGTRDKTPYEYPNMKEYYSREDINLNEILNSDAVKEFIEKMNVKYSLLTKKTTEAPLIMNEISFKGKIGFKGTLDYVEDSADTFVSFLKTIGIEKDKNTLDELKER